MSDPGAMAGRAARWRAGQPVLDADERATFLRDGVLRVPGWVSPEQVAAARDLAVAHLQARVEPLELEADVGYPGAPSSRQSSGGQTVRRLLRAAGRGEAFLALAASPAMGELMRELVGPHPLLVQAHHNCVMTKMPGFSSATNWHQDVRYWSYPRPELVSAWFALGAETPDNGALLFLPGTHRALFARDRLDDQLFLRQDREDNRALIAGAISPSLAAGDLVLFHCRTFHAAGRNATDATKFSPVFTYRDASNVPLPGTRSASSADIAL
jgi:phytanoyl-CoA hydroxylase